MRVTITVPFDPHRHIQDYEASRGAQAMPTAALRAVEDVVAVEGLDLAVVAVEPVSSPSPVEATVRLLTRGGDLDVTLTGPPEDVQELVRRWEGTV